MEMIDKPVWYEVQKQKVHIAIAQGRPIAKASKEKADEPILMAVLDVNFDGHILCWMITSNDMSFFNSLLHGKVDFGTGTSQSLFPLELGTGPSCETDPKNPCAN